MASVTSQVIFHPLVSRSLQVGSTTLGRDKLYRAIQYLARFLAWYHLRKGNKDNAVPWVALKSHIALARKLLRLGKPVEHMQTALRAALANGTPSEQITTVARQLAYAAYLSFDAIVWANTVKFLALQPTTAQRISKISNRFWLAGILLSIGNSFVKGSRLRQEAKRLRFTKEKDTEFASKIKTLQATQKGVKYQLTLDMLDVWLPATALGLVNLSDGAAGALGFITSIMALRKQWDSVSK